MKTKLFVRQHTLINNANVIEIWHNETFIGTVTGADEGGVRVISKFPMAIRTECGVTTNVAEVIINHA